MQKLFPKRPIQKGDRVVVGSFDYLTVVVESVVPEPYTDRVAVHLDWGEHGKSRVWEHDEGKTWHRYEYVN